MEAPYSDELLVDMVRARENLFDKGRVDYKDEQARAESWAAIASCFGMRVDECQTRWVRLRERFGRELRLHKRGVAAASKEWPLFARMRWLERFIQPRNRVGPSKAQSSALHIMYGDVHARHRAMGSAPAHRPPRPATGSPEPAPATPAAPVATASDSGDGQTDGDGGPDGGEAAEDAVAPMSTVSPLWPHSFKLWAGHHGSLEDGEDDGSQQDIAVDLATHPSVPSHPSVASNLSTSPQAAREASASPWGLAGAYPTGPLPAGPASHEADFRESVRQSLRSMAAALDTLNGLVSSRASGGWAADDPDEMLARSLAASMRRLPRARRSQAKLRLLAVLAELEDQDGL